MRYHYDNSAANVRNPNQPPQRVRHGNQATDEMAHLSLQVLPRGAQDRRMELHEAIMRHRLEKYPGDFTSQFNLGALMLSRGGNADAVRYLRGAVAARPDHPMALNMLGVALVSSGNVNEAAGFFERAIQANPRFTNARYNLANALAEQQRWEPAAAEFRKVLADNPDDSRARLRRRRGPAPRAGSAGSTPICRTRAAARSNPNSIAAYVGRLIEGFQAMRLAAANSRERLVII